MYNILIVDDEADIRYFLGKILEEEGYTVRCVGTAKAALRALHTRPPDLALLDIWLPDPEMDGMRLLEQILRKDPASLVVMISGHGTVETAVRAIQLGAYDFIEKPFTQERLLQTIQRALEKRRLRDENAQLRARFGLEERLLGESVVLEQLQQTIDKVASSDVRALLFGPPGSGKELIARQIHQRSHRKRAPFSVVNCASLYPGRMEAELFGVEGSDNSNTPGRIGVFERSQGGTVYLETVSDMPMATQDKIVHVLEKSRFQRIGGQEYLDLNVRFLASTYRDLEELIAEKKFREELYYRLKVVLLRVPDLMERRKDIPILSRHFLEQACAYAGVAQRNFSSEAIRVLEAYDWPGSIRQLKNTIDWIVTMFPNLEGNILPKHLPPEITGDMQGSKDHIGIEFLSKSLRDARKLFEQRYFAMQIKRFGGNVKNVAKFVGFERTALHRKLKSLGIPVDRPPKKTFRSSFKPLRRKRG